MPAYIPTDHTQNEPLRRFYPPQGEQPQQTLPDTPSFPLQQATVSGRKKRGDATYLAHRHPVLLQRLYNAADVLLDTYPKHDFIYDAYPDYLSLRLMRNRLLRENSEITENFLQEGCPISWLNLLADTVISELLCRKRCLYRNPNGEASTTSVQFASRS